MGTLQQALCTKSRQAQNTGVSVVTQSFLHDLGDTLQPGRELFKAFDRKGRKEIPQSSQRTADTPRPLPQDTRRNFTVKSNAAEEFKGAEQESSKVES